MLVVVELADGLADVVAVDEDTVLTVVLVAGAVAAVPPTDAVTGVTAWLTDPEVAPELPLTAGGVPPEFSSRAITATATPKTATPAPPAKIRRRVNGEAEFCCAVKGSS